MSGRKLCHRCGESKPATDRHFVPKPAGGHWSTCRPCRRAMSKTPKARAQHRRRNAAWRKAHPEAWRAQSRAATRRWLQKDGSREKARAARAAWKERDPEHARKVTLRGQRAHLERLAQARTWGDRIVAFLRLVLPRDARPAHYRSALRALSLAAKRLEALR